MKHPVCIGSLWNHEPERQTFTEAVKRETGRALWESSRFARGVFNALRKMGVRRA